MSSLIYTSRGVRGATDNLDLAGVRYWVSGKDSKES